MNQIDLSGHHAVVTGGAQGLGFAMARRIVASGATVTLWDLDQSLLASARESLGQAATTVVVDISDWEQVDAARRRTEEIAAPAALLVNSAGLNLPKRFARHTAARLFDERFDDQPQVGDHVAIGRALLTVHRLRDDRVAEVGLRFVPLGERLLSGTTPGD